MLVATFGPSTAWVGKAITHKRGKFTLEDYGKITAADVVSYDRQGVLRWPDEKTRGWVYKSANPSPAVSRSAAARPQSRKRSNAGFLFIGWFIIACLALGIVISLVTFLWPIAFGLFIIGAVVWTIMTTLRT